MNDTSTVSTATCPYCFRRVPVQEGAFNEHGTLHTGECEGSGVPAPIARPWGDSSTATMTPAQIRRDYAGVVCSSRSRTTGTVVTLYRNDAQGLDDCDGTCPYSVVCEEHGGVVAVHSQYAGRRSMARPDDWCEDCREMMDAKTKAEGAR